MVMKRSASGYGETVVRLTRAIESRGLTAREPARDRSCPQMRERFGGRSAAMGEGI